MTRLQTKRLILTPMSDEALAQRMELTTDPHDRAAYGQMLDGSRARPQTRLFTTAWEIRQKNGETVGDACFKGPADTGEVEIGYGIDAAYRGRGYATEAVRALIDWAFSQDGVYFVTAEREQDNLASARVLDKLGFVSDGEGAEGPRFVLEKPPTAWVALGLCLGSGVGVSMGLLSDNLALGLCLGLAVGVALGTALDAADRKKRAAARQARVQKHNRVP